MVRMNHSTYLRSVHRGYSWHDQSTFDRLRTADPRLFVGSTRIGLILHIPVIQSIKLRCQSFVFNKSVISATISMHNSAKTFLFWHELKFIFTENNPFSQRAKVKTPINFDPRIWIRPMVQSSLVNGLTDDCMWTEPINGNRSNRLYSSNRVEIDFYIDILSNRT